MIIVLEGCDGSGKSTLAKYLCAKYDLEYHHEGPLPPQVPALEYYGGLVERCRWSIHRGDVKGFVLDRLAFGEMVYGPIYRGHSRLSWAEWRVMKRVLRAADALHIVCQTNYHATLANWIGRKGEMITDRQQFERVYDRYRTLTAQDDYDFHYFYDYLAPGELERLERFIAHINGAMLPRSLPPGSVGSPRARYLFVGEKGSQPDSLTADLPFFGHVNSSAYLTEALDAAGFTEDEVAFTNAQRWDGVRCSWVIPDKIIALGKVAARECTARSLHHIELPHPQYWKRFHATEFQTYVELLRKARG